MSCNEQDKNLYLVDSNNNVINCVDSAKPSSYDLPGKPKDVLIGQVLTSTRLNGEKVLLAKTTNAILINSKLRWGNGSGVVSDIIQIGAISRIVL